MRNTVLLVNFILTILLLSSCAGKELNATTGDENNPSLDKNPKVQIIEPDQTSLLSASDREDILNRKLEMAREIQKSKDKPIEYYGKIIDQHGQPVPDVTIKASIQYFGSIVNAGFLPSNNTIERVTDEKGRFSISDESGLTIGFDSFSKQGYTFQHVEPINYRSGFTASGGAESPNIISAYKIGEAPNRLLLGEARYYSLVPDGRIYSLDILNRQILEGYSSGQIHVSYTYTEGSTNLKPSDWSVTLEANGGGVIETNDALMFEAPESGYAPKWTENFKMGSENWTTRLSRKFYIKALNGEIYARLEIYFRPFFSNYKQDNKIVVKYWLNPQGSRNLYSTKQPY